jgi:uncharacterized protein YggT (Ycf19 family)
MYSKMEQTDTATHYSGQYVKESSDDHKDIQKKKTVIRAYHIIWFIVGVIEVLLGFRFVFEIAGANQYSPFVQLVYVLSYPLAQPFQRIFGITSIQGSVFDWSLLIAGLVYLLIGYGLVQFLRIVKPVSVSEVHKSAETI